MKNMSQYMFEILLNPKPSIKACICKKIIGKIYKHKFYKLLTNRKKSTFTYNPVDSSRPSFWVFRCTCHRCSLRLADSGGIDSGSDRFDWVNRLTLIGLFVDLDPCNIILRGVFNRGPHNLYPLGCQYTFNQTLF